MFHKWTKCILIEDPLGAWLAEKKELVRWKPTQGRSKREKEMSRSHAKASRALDSGGEGFHREEWDQKRKTIKTKKGPREGDDSLWVPQQKGLQQPVRGKTSREEKGRSRKGESNQKKERLGKNSRGDGNADYHSRKVFHRATGGNLRRKRKGVWRRGEAIERG